MREREGSRESQPPELEPYNPTEPVRELMWMRLGFKSAEQACALLWAALHPDRVEQFPLGRRRWSF